LGKRGKFGPGFLIAAAFIGPGTVTSATIAGATFGFSLVWVILLAVLSAVVLQEMVGRFSLVSGLEIAQALVKIPRKGWVRVLLGLLAFLAIVVGCAAYEAGNIMGGSLGLNIITGIPPRTWALLISLTAFFILLKGNYPFIERFLISIVILMGCSFLVSSLLVRPDLRLLARGMIPRLPTGSLTLVLALLGTTIVPYNLFLHSSSILKKWRDERDLQLMRWDTGLSIGLGGIITIAIIITAATTFYLKFHLLRQFTGTLPSITPGDLSLQLEPLFGGFARLCFGVGLFAAGLSSAITAPYAAAWTARGLFGWPEKSHRFRVVFSGIILSGVVISSFSLHPLSLIIVAQVTNALLLPVVALFIGYLLNQKQLKGYRNTLAMNLLFFLVFTVIILINIRKFV